MSEFAKEIIFFVFAAALFYLGYDMVQMSRPWPIIIAIFMLSFLLVTFAGVGLSTLKNLKIKWNSDAGFEFGFERYKPTEEERELVEEFAKDKPSPEIEKKGREFIEKAEERPPEKRSAEDYLALAAG